MIQAAARFREVVEPTPGRDFWPVLAARVLRSAIIAYAVDGFLVLHRLAREIKSFESGPKLASAAVRSVDFAAATSSLAASSGVRNTLTEGVYCQKQ